MTPQQKRAFVLRMAAARAKRRNPGKSRKFERCVRKVSRRRRGKRVRDPAAVCAAALRRKRRRNPSRYHTHKARGVGRGRYIITARKSGGALLRFVSGNKFAERGNPIVFPSHQAASIMARLLRRMFPVLKRYAPRATAL